jgi:hypothetical protein
MDYFLLQINPKRYKSKINKEGFFFSKQVLIGRRKTVNSFDIIPNK